MIKINFFGDFMSNKAHQLSIGYLLKKELDSSNLNIVNLEAPIISNTCKPIYKSGPNIFQNISSIEFLENNSFNLISLANNHTMDFGMEGLKNTQNTIKKSNVIGAGNWSEAYQPYIYESQGIKIGVLSLTQREFGVLDDENNIMIGTAWMLHPIVDSMIIETKKIVNYLFIYSCRYRR